MKEKRRPQIAVIASHDAAEFESVFNARVLELGNVTGHELKFGPDGYQAVIFYDVVEKIPTSVKDEFELQGIRLKCTACPHLEDDHDGRKKYHGCKYSHTGLTNKYGDACEVLYRDIKAGRVVIEGVEL